MRQYDAGGLAMLLNGKGRARLSVADGALAVRPEAGYRVAQGGGVERTVTAAAGELVLDLDLDGLTDLRVQPAGVAK